MQTTKSFFAARGDSELRGPNATIAALELSRSDFMDLTASRASDGMWLQLVYRKVKDLKLESSSINDGTWFRNTTLPANIQLSFNSSVSKTSVTDTTFRWVWSGGGEAVTASGITYSEQNRMLVIPLPAGVTSSYVGQLTLVGDGFENDDGERLLHPVKISMEMSTTDVNTPRPGQVPHTAEGQAGGRMEVGRLVVARGMDADQMIGQFISQRRLESDDVLKVVQDRGPNGTTEVFLLWWLETSPKVTSLTPLPNSTTPTENAPDQIIMEFDQPVDQQYLNGDDGIDRILIDGTRWQDLTAPALTRLDADGRVWMLSGLTEITVVGLHTLVVRYMPNRFGLYPSPPALFSWQVQTLLIAGGTCFQDEFVGDGITTEFVLSFTPTIECESNVFLDGIWYPPNRWSFLTGPDRLVFSTAPSNGAEIWFRGIQA